MYHSISDDPETGVGPYYKTCTSPCRFAEQMAWLAAAGWRGVTLAEGLAALQGQSAVGQGPRGKWPEKNASSAALPSALAASRNNEKFVAITFDDGFRDFHSAAFPTLQRHGFSATMYLPTAFIGNERRTFKAHECLTWVEVRELAAAGMEFGSHTVNHPKLVELPWTEIEIEVRASRFTLEDKLGCPVPSFAYPYAFPEAEREFTRYFREVLIKAGYSSSVTTAVGISDSGDDALHLPRLPVNSADDQALFTAKLSGAYDWFAIPQKFAKNARRWLGITPRRTFSCPRAHYIRPPQT